MSWTMLDDDYWSSPNVRAAGPHGGAAYAASLSYCGKHAPNGHVPRDVALFVAFNRKRTIRTLVELGLWVEDGDGYRIPDYAATNRRTQDEVRTADERVERTVSKWAARRAAQTPEQQQARRDADAARKRAARSGRTGADTTGADTVADASGHGADTGADTARTPALSAPLPPGPPNPSITSTSPLLVSVTAGNARTDARGGGADKCADTVADTARKLAPDVPEIVRRLAATGSVTATAPHAVDIHAANEAASAAGTERTTLVMEYLAWVAGERHAGRTQGLFPDQILSLAQLVRQWDNVLGAALRWRERGRKPQQPRRGAVGPLPKASREDFERSTGPEVS